MASKLENVSGIKELGARASNAMKMQGAADLRPLIMTNERTVPVMIDNTNPAASRAKEKKFLVNEVHKKIPGSTVNLNYDITDDIDAIEEERRYRAAATFLEWLVNTYDGDAFSIHMMFDRHPIFLEMLQKSIRYWAESVIKFNTAKLLPRTMWDKDTEDMMFMLYTMEDDQKTDYLKFVSSNPFFKDDYGDKELVKRGPFNPRKVLTGYRRNSNLATSDYFTRAMGGPDPKFGAINYRTTNSMPKGVYEDIL